MRLFGQCRWLGYCSPAAPLPSLCTIRLRAETAQCQSGEYGFGMVHRWANENCAGEVRARRLAAYGVRGTIMKLTDQIAIASMTTAHGVVILMQLGSCRRQYPAPRFEGA